MLKKSSKQQQQLAKLVVATLLCSVGGLSLFTLPAFAEGTVTVTDAGNPGATAGVEKLISKGEDSPDFDIYGLNSTVVSPATLEITGGDGSANGFAGTYSAAKDVSGYSVKVTDGTVGSVTGGMAKGFNASGNSVTTSGGKIGGNVTGGYVRTGNGSATNNVVTLNGGMANSNVYGGKVDNSAGRATNNTVVLSGATVNGDIFGGYGGGNKNTVTVNSGSANDVFGGFSNNGIANDNKVTINDGTARNVFGGHSGKNNSVNNVVITNGGTITGDVTGGISGIAGNPGEGTGNAAKNVVTLTGGSVTGNVFGGKVLNSSGRATNNTVVLDGAAVTGNIFGGHGGANENEVTVNKGSAGSVFGGDSNNGVANYNKVTINDGTVNTVFGGRSAQNNSTNNVVIINGGTITGDVTGGISGIVGDSSTKGTGSTEKNAVTLTGGSVAGNVYGGRITNSSGRSTNNRVELSGAVVSGDVFGGYGGGNNNEVIVNKGSANDVLGGYSNNGVATENRVTVKDGTVNKIYGGFSVNNSTNNNTVVISGGEVKDSVWGGRSRNSSADGNTVTVSGAPVFAASSFIYGAGADGDATNNTVNILANHLVIGGLVGGRSVNGTSSGNTLNIAAKDVTAGVVSRFQNMNFYLPADIANNDTMLTVNGGEKSNVRNVTFGVAALTGVNLEKGNTVNLITNANGLATDATLKTTDSATLGKASFLSANGLTTVDTYELNISKNGENSIIATVTNKKSDTATGALADDVQKSPVETRAGVVTMVNTGADLMTSQGMDNAAAAVAAAGGQAAPFAAMGGSNMRSKSGSHVDTKGFTIGLGFAKEFENKSGKLLVGPVVEYGHGKYDSYQDTAVKADGKSSYWGLGIIAKQTNNNGFYYEGSVRAGRAKSDYGSDNPITGVRVGYDSASTFWAAHVGLGKLIDIGHKNTLDYYGKYFYSHTGGDSVFINGAGITANFDSVDSHRLRVGARVTHTLNDKNKIYGGLAYQYEFNGDARATYSNGTAAPSPSIKGSSGMMELGWLVKPGKSPMVIDLGVTGWVGKQSGVTANLQANWTF